MPLRTTTDTPRPLPEGTIVNHHSATRPQGQSDAAPGVDQQRPAYHGNVPPAGWTMKAQPDVQPVSVESLDAHVSTAYVAALAAEKFCCERFLKQANEPFTDKAWRELVDLHKKNVDKFTDYFLAVESPLVMPSTTLDKLNYSMSRRLWLCIKELLGLMRKHLPASREHMEGFVLFSFEAFKHLYEYTKSLWAIWSELLGDVARFGTVIQNSERDIWARNGQMWYLRAMNLNPGVGRVLHHIAITLRLEPMRALFYCTKSLCAVTPFLPARETMPTLLKQIISETRSGLDIAAVKLHRIVVMDCSDEEFDAVLLEYTSALNDITTISWEYRERYQLAVININSLLSYGSDKNPISRALSEAGEGESFSVEASKASDKAFERALTINGATIKTILLHKDISPLLPYLHVWFVFLYRASQLPPDKVPSRIFNWPWEKLALDSAQSSMPSAEVVSTEQQPLPEDYAMRGLKWFSGYQPKNQFERDKRDEDERVVEQEWMTKERARRCAWLKERVVEATKQRPGEEKT